MPKPIASLVFLSLALAACGGGEPFSVLVVFPDEAARQQTRELVLMALAPDAGGSCAALIAGSAAPGDPGYPIEAQVTLSYPLAEGAEGLRLETAGAKLFFAEARGDGQETLLRGCTPVEVGADAPREATIVLQWVVSACEQDGDCPDDGQWCTGTPRCDQGRCLADPPDCDDGVGCTLDSCDEAGDACSHVPQDDACDDHDVCTGSETCDPQAGCLAGTPLACDDGEYCNGAEGCDAVQGCLGARAPCDDEVDCTLDSCDEDTDSCGVQPDHAACDDGDACTGTESCDEQLGCQPGVPLVCDDGAFCNGSERCDPLQGCLPGAAPSCDDGVPCTLDACDEVADTCAFTPNAGGCPDIHVGAGPETCPHELPDGSDVTTCDYWDWGGLGEASLAAPAEGARFLLYDDLGGQSVFEGPVDIPGGSWIGAAPGIDPANVVLFGPRWTDNGPLRLAGDDIHVDGLTILVTVSNMVAISSWPAEGNSAGATTGHLIEHVIAFAVDQEIQGYNGIVPPVSLSHDTTVRDCHFLGYFELSIDAQATSNLRFVHNTFVLFQSNDDSPLEVSGSQGFTFANNVVLSLAREEAALVLADPGTTDLTVTGNLIEGFDDVAVGQNPGDPGTRVSDNLLAQAELESPRVPRFLVGSTQRIAGPVPGEGRSLDGVDIQGLAGVYPGAYQQPSALGLPRRSVVRLGRGDCGGSPCDLDADQVGQDVQEAVWSAWPGAEVQVFPSPIPYAGFALIGWPVSLRGMGQALDEVVLENSYDDDMLEYFDIYDRHDATLIVLQYIDAPVHISDLSLRLDSSRAGDNWAIFSEDPIDQADQPPHRFERLEITSAGVETGLYGGFMLGARSVVQDSLVWGGFATCAQLGPRTDDAEPTPASNAKIVNLTCRLIGADVQAPAAFLDVAAADGAVLVDIAAESIIPIPLLRAQRRSTGDTGVYALDPPGYFLAVAISALNASVLHDGFDDTISSFDEWDIEPLVPGDPLFVDAGDSHLAQDSTALDSGTNPADLDGALTPGISLDGVDRSLVQAVDRGCYEQGL
jgi:hypothetical protein